MPLAPPVLWSRDCGQHGSYRTNALADWLNGVTLAYSSFQSDLAGAEATRDHAIAASYADLSRDYAAADK